MVDYCSLLFEKCSSVLPAEAQGSVGSRGCSGRAAHGQTFPDGRDSKWKQGTVLFLGLPKNSLLTFPTEFSGRWGESSRTDLMGETRTGLEKSSGLPRQRPESLSQSDAACRLLLRAVL